MNPFERLIHPGCPPVYMGILNLTPDSFSDGGRFQEPGRALDQARALVASGAALLDLGAESTRPGAEPLGWAEEWARLAPVLELLRRELPGTPLSLDTRHAEVAARGLDQGAAVVNDVTGFRDPAMLDLARRSGAGLIAMRSRLEEGRFRMPPYGEAGETGADRAIGELAEVRDRVLDAGVAPERLLLDPGFGFGTTYGEDAALWAALPSLPARLGWPAARVCVGVSRKRFTAWRAGTPDLAPDRRDGLATALHREAIDWGFRVFRTHSIGLPIEPGPSAQEHA